MDSFFIREEPEDNHPYDRLLDLGVHPLSNPELLSLILSTGPEDTESLPVAQSLLKRYRTLRALARGNIRELTVMDGMDVARATRLAAASEFGRRVAKEVTKSAKVDSPAIVCQLLAQDFRALNRESLRVLVLDTKFQLLKIEEISLGTINESLAHPREIFRPAILYSAYSIILAHNHPSGDPAPSKADRVLTRRLVEVGTLLQITLQDHIIIGGDLRPGVPSYYSFKEAGEM